MQGNKIPSYFGLRIYLSSTILYFFLVFPFFLFIAYQTIPRINETRDLMGRNVAGAVDSLAAYADSLHRQELDSIITRAHATVTEDADNIPGAAGTGTPGTDSGVNGPVIPDSGEGGPFQSYFKIAFFVTLLSYLIGFIYNRPFKRYFREKRKGKKGAESRLLYCRRQLFRMPWLNSLILILPNLTVIIFSLIVLLSRYHFEQELERSLFTQLLYLTLVASLLEFLFAFYWQRHRVHMKYIEQLFTPEELRVRLTGGRGSRIRDRFLVASGMTTFLPLMIVLVYLILSFTSIRSLELGPLSDEQKQILIGPWSNLSGTDGGSEVAAEADTVKVQEPQAADTFEKLFYVNAIDALVMLVGIGSGILVSLVYLLLFIRWNNQDISVPLKELLTSIRNTRAGEVEHYTLVRSGDEIGELAEGYNAMTGKIHEYVENISRMNRELEDKVKERTEEVVQQKEEIEAQKEEIEAQLELVTQQKDTIVKQNAQILDSIRYAEKIQSALLPPAEHLSGILSDHFILFQPRDIVSGDYYWTSVEGDRLMVAAADCTGHGVPGAFLSLLGISSMNEIVTRRADLHASQILGKLRNFVVGSLYRSDSGEKARDGIEIALCVIDTRSLTVEFAGANRPLYLVRKNRLLQFRGDRIPIGIYEERGTAFTDHVIQLEKGDSIYLFTDGYVDQLGGPKRKTFRSKQFRQLLIQIQDHSMGEQKKILTDKMETWRGDVEQIDDILVMGFRV